MDNQKELGFSIKILGTDAQLSELAKIEEKLRASAKARKLANDTIKEGEKLQKQLNKELREGTITQDEYEVGTKQLANTNKEALNTVTASQLATKQLNKEKSNLTNTIQLETKVSKEQATSYNSLSAQYSLMKKQINAMTVAERENTEAGRKLVAESKKIRDQMNSMQQATGNSSLNVGKYSEALQGASGILGMYGGQLGRTINMLTSLNTQVKGIAASLKAQEAATAATTAATGGASKAMKIFKIALISTGIGAIVVALGTLVGGFLSTQRGADAVSSALRPLQAIMQRVVGFIQDTAIKSFERFKNAITNPKDAFISLGKAIKDNIINRFKALQVFSGAITKIFDGDFKGAAKDFADGAIQVVTGVTDATDKLMTASKNTGDFIKESIEQGKQLDAMQKQIERADIERTRRAAELNRIAKENTKIAQDQTKSSEERLAAAQRALNAEQTKVALEVKYHNLRVKQKKLENSLNDTSREDDLELAKIQAERDSAAASSARLSTQYQNTLNTIKKQAITLTKQEQKEVEKLATDNLKLAKTIRDNKLQIQADSIGKSMDMLMNQYEDEYSQLEKSLVTQQEIDEAKGASKEQLTQKNILINERLLQLDEKLATDSRQLIIENDKKTNDLRLKELDQHQTLEELAVRNKVINNQITEEEGEKAILELKKEYLTQKLALIDTETEEGKIKYQELVNAIDEINNPVEGKKTGLAELLSISDEEAEQLKARAVAVATEVANAIANMEAIDRENKLKKDLDTEEKLNEEKIAQLDDRLEKGVITQEQYNALRSRLDQEYDNTRESIEREAFERNKEAAILQAAINGALAITQIWATTPKVDFGISTAALIAASAISTGLQIKQIKKQEYADGGLITGRIGSSEKNIPTQPNGDNVLGLTSDGGLATFKTGEAVLNSKHIAALGGGSTLAAIGVPGFASGGMIPPNPAPQFNSRQLQNVAKLDDGQLKEMFGYMGSLIDTKIQNLRVSEYEVSDTQSTVSTIEQENTF